MKNGSITLKKPLAIAALGALLLVPLCSSTVRAGSTDLTITLSKLDVTHGVGTEPVDQVDLIANFKNTEASEGSKCDTSSDSPINGFVLGLQEGTCGTIAPATTVTVPSLSKIGKNKYKYEGVTIEGAVVDAILTVLGKSGRNCGQWHLVLDATPLDLASIQTNPVATSITLGDGSFGRLLTTAGAIDR